MRFGNFGNFHFSQISRSKFRSRPSEYGGQVVQILAFLKFHLSSANALCRAAPLMSQLSKSEHRIRKVLQLLHSRRAGCNKFLAVIAPAKLTSEEFDCSQNKNPISFRVDESIDHPLRSLRNSAPALRTL